MPSLNYYAVLGVSLQATQDDIKKSYRKLALQYHPDRNRGNQQAEQKIREINEAYEILGDPDARKSYDRLRMGHVEPLVSPQEETDQSLSPSAVLQRMEGTLAEEARKQLFKVMMKNTARIKEELSHIRDRVIEAQGYDTFLDNIVKQCAEESLKELVTDELWKLRERLVDIAVEMVCTEVPGAFREVQARDQVKRTLHQSCHEGWVQGYIQACELLYERK